MKPSFKDETVICSACQQDTTRDAKVEMTAWEYALMKNKPCRHCGATIFHRI